MHDAPRFPLVPFRQPSRRTRKAQALERIAATRHTRVPGVRGSSRLVVTGIVVALGATSFVAANAAEIEIAPSLCSSTTSSIRGTAGNDVLVGTSGADNIWGAGGDDVIFGMQGNDRLCGAEGNDRIYGSSGEDYIDGGPGTDVLRGDTGVRDTCLNGEQLAGCELTGTTTPAPPTTPVPTTPTTPAPTTPTTPAPTTPTTPAPTTPTTTPAPTGRFNTLPVGATLPSEQQCATAVRRMTENRPTNATYNATRGTTPNATYPRVTGNFTGTTDEIIQWAACKWGIDEDLVRAQTAVESWWDQRAGGDLTSTQSSCHPDVRTTTGQCPESVGLLQVRYLYHGSAFVNSNAIRSSAYNIDYAYAHWRACFEGQFTWLNTVERGAEYRSGDAMGCAGVWFSGRWRTPAAIQYMTKVDDYLRTKIWTQTSFGPSTPTGPTVPPTTPAPTTPTTPAPTTPTTPAPTTPTTPAPTTPTTPAPTTPTTPAPTTPTTPAPTTPTTPAPTTPTTPAPTTPPTTAPSGAAFTATFTGNTGLGAFRSGVYHRNTDSADYPAGTGGTWQADHDMSCGAPTTFRTVDARNRADALYMCADHLMTTMGDVDGYSVVWFSPNQTFTNIHRVCWDVNGTNMGNRKWWEVAVQPVSSPDLSVLGGSGLMTASHLPARHATAVVASNGVMDQKMRVNDSTSPTAWTSGNDKATRFQNCLVDNRNGTTTLTVQRPGGPVSVTTNMSFPSGQVRVVFKDHSYTPDKSEYPFERPGYSWHWDNIIIS